MGLAFDIGLVLAIVTYCQTHCGPNVQRHDLSAAQHFPTRAPFPFSSLSLSGYLSSQQNSLSSQSLYYWACILTKAMSKMNDALCLNIAGHLTWPSTISGKLSEHDIYLSTKQQGSIAQHKIQTQQQGNVNTRALHVVECTMQTKTLPACLLDNY